MGQGPSSFSSSRKKGVHAKQNQVKRNPKKLKIAEVNEEINQIFSKIMEGRIKEVRLTLKSLDEIPAALLCIDPPRPRLREKIQQLWLDFNFICAIPPDISEVLWNLRALGLSANQLSSIPHSFETFQYLKVLTLSYNRFDSFPETLCTIPSLQEIHIGWNNLTSLPQSLTRLPSLLILDVKGNPFGEFPEVLLKLTTLTHLNLRRCRISSIPEGVGALTELRELMLAENPLTSLPRSILKLKHLGGFPLFNCQMTDFCVSFGALNELKYIALSDNNLTSFCSLIHETKEKLSLSHVVSIDLNHNRLECLSDESDESLNLWRSMKNLQYFAAAQNSIRFLGPEFGAHFANLKSIDLSGNKLEDISPSIAHLSSLSTLDLSDNLLTTTPSLCQAIGSLHSLTELYLGRNKLDKIPEEFAALTQLNCLNLWHNNISELPEEVIVNWLGFQEYSSVPKCLFLSYNSFTSFPSSVAVLNHLNELYLSGNSISEIPADIPNKMTQLQILMLSNMNTPLKLPQSFSEWENLRKLYLRGTELELPHYSCIPRHLTDLDIPQPGPNNKSGSDKDDKPMTLHPHQETRVFGHLMTDCIAPNLSPFHPPPSSPSSLPEGAEGEEKDVGRRGSMNLSIGDAMVPFFGWAGEEGEERSPEGEGEGSGEEVEPLSYASIPGSPKEKSAYFKGRESEYMVQLLTSVESAEELDKETVELFEEMEMRWKEEEERKGKEEAPSGIFLDIHKEIKASFVQGGGKEEEEEVEGAKLKDFQRCHFDKEEKPTRREETEEEEEEEDKEKENEKEEKEETKQQLPTTPTLNIPGRRSRSISGSSSPVPSPTPSSFYSIPPSPANAPTKQSLLPNIKREKDLGLGKEKVEGVLGGEFVQSWNKRGEASRFDLGISKMASPKNEDTFCVCSPFRHNRQEDFFAVFDGHGGGEASAYCAKHFHIIFRRMLEEKEAAALDDFKATPTRADSSPTNPRHTPSPCPPSPSPPVLLPPGVENEGEGEKGQEGKKEEGKGKEEEKEDSEAGKEGEKVTEEDRAILDALRSAFLRTNQEMYAYFKKNKLSPKRGTTAVVAFVCNSKVYVANTGDSRCVYVTPSGEAIRVSFDHTPHVDYEVERIKRLNGVVIEDPGSGNRTYRVASSVGGLGVTRAMGDFSFYPFVSTEPYLTILDLKKCQITPLTYMGLTEEEDSSSSPFSSSSYFSISPSPTSLTPVSWTEEKGKGGGVVVLGCDGVWDTIEDEECAEIIYKEKKKGKEGEGAEEEEGEVDVLRASVRLRDAAYLKGSRDDITSMVLQLPNLANL